MTAGTHYDTEDYVRRITALLAQAESTNTPAEAEMYVSKAQELMLSHAISEELIRAAQVKKGVAQEPEKIIRQSVKLTGVYRKVESDIVVAVAFENDCRSVVHDQTWSTPHTYVITVVGHESDVDNVLRLSASLLIQHSTAKRTWERKGGVPTHVSSMEKFKIRRQFTISYAQGVGSRLQLARREAKITVAEAQVEAQRVTIADAQQSVALALVDRKKRVDNWIDEKYGRSLRSVTHNYAGGGYSAAEAGYEAGSRADLGQPRVGGTRPALEG